MSNFDVFINGIQPNRIADTQAIVDILSEKFKVDQDKIEKILATPDTRIKKFLSEEKADKLQHALSKVGLICFCQPSVEESAEKQKPMSSACPNCGAVFSKILNSPPKSCHHCGIFIKKFLEINSSNNKNDKREQIKQQFLQEKAARHTQAQKGERGNSPFIHKEEKMAIDDSKKKPSHTIAYAIGGCCLTAVALFFTHQANLLPWVNNPLPLETVTVATNTEDKTEINHSQNMLQKNHESTEVINTFGLDPNAFVDVNSKQEINPPIEKNSLINTFLLDVGSGDHEWNLYLARHANQAIIKKNFVLAKQIIPHLTNTEYFIVLSDTLSKTKSDPELKAQIDMGIMEKVGSSPISLQPQYYSRMALQQTDKQLSSALFDQAEEAWNMLTDPAQQLLSALKISVFYFKADNINSSNQYFNKVKRLLPKVEGVENKINAHLAISQAFQQIEQKEMAVKWLHSADKLAKDLSKQSKDQLLYYAIRSFLNSGLTTDAVNLASSVENPMNKALTYMLLASYFSYPSEYLTPAENLLDRSTVPVEQKALVLSRIAQQYAMLSNMTKAKALFDKSFQLVKDLPESNEKDTLLSLMTINYAKPMKNSSAIIIVKGIQSTKARAYILNKLSALSQISKQLDQ